MTLGGGYALGPGEALEDLQMGDGAVLSLKVTGRQSNGLVTVIEGVALVGGPPLHLHEAEDEVVICVDGELAFQIGDQRGTLQSGGVLWFPRAVPHAVANLSGQPVRLITVVTPGGIEDYFRAQRDYWRRLLAGSHSTRMPSPEFPATRRGQLWDHRSPEVNEPTVGQ